MGIFKKKLGAPAVNIKHKIFNKPTTNTNTNTNANKPTVTNTNTNTTNKKGGPFGKHFIKPTPSFVATPFVASVTAASAPSYDIPSFFNAPPPLPGPPPIDLKAIAADADNNVTTMTNNFNNEFTNIQTMNTFYNTEIINSKNTNELYSIYLTKNKNLDGNIKDFHSDVLTNDRKTYYEFGALEVLVNWNHFFLYMYFTLFFTFILGIVFSENTIPKYQSILLALTLGLYPFIISPIVQRMVSGFTYARNLYPKNVYNSL